MSTSDTFLHGTRYGYEKMWCRCDDCLDWHNLYNFGKAKMLQWRRERIESREALHTPSVYSVQLHRASGEDLCAPCRNFLRNFK